MKSKNHATDAMILSGIRVMSILLNIISSAILSRKLQLHVYGTYSAANLVVSIATSFTILGMMDAANYFYHNKELNKKDSINTIAFLQVTIGLLCAATILLLKDSITAYFNNPMLDRMYVYLIFRPMLENLSNSLLSLQMAVGKARAVGIRNGFFSLCKLAAVLLTSYVTERIITLFVAYLIMDVMTVAYYYFNFRKADFPINPFAFKKDMIVPILQFSVPMGIYVISNTFARDVDKLVIGYFENTENLAIYTNCATPLPFGVVSAAFLTIIVPIVTSMIQKENFEAAQKLFRNFLSISAISTAILTVTCMILSEEAILLLYGEKYLPGKWIFVMYLVVDLVKFANSSIILSAKGQTGTLMRISIGMLIVNGILNLILYHFMGMLGPTIATVLTTVLSTTVILLKSGKILNTSMLRLFDMRVIGRLLGTLIIFAGIGSLMRVFLLNIDAHYVIRLFIVGGSMCVGLLLVHMKQMKLLFRALNNDC